jgi:RimJ/RimL family protein N-acetyltransferase
MATTSVTLTPYTDGDLALTVALESDATVKRELGGPIGAAEATDIHRDRLARMSGGELFFTVAVEGSTRPVGIAAVFRTPWEGDVIYELGVMLIPGGSGRGVGLEVARRLAERARTDLGLSAVHCFVAVTNEPANVICRKLGWARSGECDLDYEGRAIRCNHWILDLTPGPPGAAADARPAPIRPAR